MNDLIRRKDAIETIHHTIFEFFDICEDDEESPFTDKDVRLLELNKAICNNVKQLSSAQQWIPCSKKLPEYRVRVLTIDKDGEYTVNYIIDEDDGEWFWHDAVAWMPLPEPYMRGDEE